MTTPPGWNPQGTPPGGQPPGFGGQPPAGGQPPFGQQPYGQQPPPPPPPQGQPPYGDAPGQPGQPGQPPYGGAPGQPGQPPYGGAPGQPPYGGAPQQYGQAPYGQPGYGQPYGAPAPGGRSKVPLVLTGLVVVLAAVGLGLYFLVFSGGADTSSPEAAAKSFWEAAKDNDAGTAKKVVCKADRDSIKGDSLSSGDVSLESVTVDKPKSTGDTTIVPTHLKFNIGGKTQTVDVPTKVIKEDGEFRVCDIDGFDGSSSGSSGSDDGGSGSPDGGDIFGGDG